MTAGCGDYPVWAAALARRSSTLPERLSAGFFCYYWGSTTGAPRQGGSVERPDEIQTRPAGRTEGQVFDFSRRYGS